MTIFTTLQFIQNWQLQHELLSKDQLMIDHVKMWIVDNSRAMKVAVTSIQRFHLFIKMSTPAKSWLYNPMAKSLHLTSSPHLEIQHVPRLQNGNSKWNKCKAHIDKVIYSSLIPICIWQGTSTSASKGDRQTPGYNSTDLL